MPANAQPENDDFAAAAEISDTWGSVQGDTTDATAETGEPSHAGLFPEATVWYRWTAPKDGEMQFDTLTTGATNDTVLAVYTGTSPETLGQVAANDDLYRNSQQNQTGQYLFKFDPADPATAPVVKTIFTFYNQPYSGPSLVRFNAKAGTTYYIAVSSKQFSFHYTGVGFGGLGNSYLLAQPGPFTLNWAYHPSGVFRFASEDIDQTGVQNEDGTPMLLHKVSETEAYRRPSGNYNGNQFSTTLHTYYTYDAPGALLTITRVGGSAGRVTLDYATEDGDANVITNGDLPALEYTDYSPVSGTLVFDDYEMSKTIFIPIYDDYGDAQPNRAFTVVLSNPQVDWMESWEVPPPQLDPSFSRILVRILDTDISPRGPSATTDTNAVPPTVYSLEPTNAVFNFQKANYRITRDAKDYWKATPITLYVNRTGTNKASETVNWRVNNFFKSSVLNENGNNEFPLQPGSDYATPNPKNDGNVMGVTPDFSFSAYSGTLTFPNKNPQAITFEVLNHGDQQFNEDFVVELYQVDDGKTVPCGMVDQAKVTILFDDLTPPAGSVDQLHNADFNTTMALPTALVPTTTPPNMAHPGTDGQVLGLTVLRNGLVQTNFTVVTNNGVLETNMTTTVLSADKAVIVGDFFSYDQVSRNRIAGVNVNGSLDTSFNPGSGANAFISAIDQTPNGQLIIGGAFTSYNGTLRNRIARLNSNGTLDSAFTPGFGANGTVRAVAAQADGKIVIGGDFTSYGGTPRNYLARLNANGTLDTTFDPGTGLNGPVFSIGLESTTTISLDRSALGDDQEDRQDINLGTTNAGVLTVDYDMYYVPDLLRVYYNGVKLYDTDYIADAGHLVIPFPGGTSVITIVINEGGGNFGTVWDYVAQAQVSGASQVYVGGDFSAVGGVPGQDHFTRILNDGSVDQTFNPGAGA
ncbi:MAG: Calx-beta domain-containing protein, partial [Verrucomicrobiota bacterium]